jgi:hypothetical protein
VKALLMIALALCTACTAPRDSATHFGKAKYKLQTRSKPKQGLPSVRQDWWGNGPLWQRQYTPYTRSIR